MQFFGANAAACDKEIITARIPLLLHLHGAGAAGGAALVGAIRVFRAEIALLPIVPCCPQLLA